MSTSLVEVSVDGEIVDDREVSVELSGGIVVGVDVVVLESVVATEELVLGTVVVDVTVDELILLLSVDVGDVIIVVDDVDIKVELIVDESVMIEDKVV